MSKKVYRIGEAAKLLGVKTSTLRFWEDKFSQIRPRRTDTDQRYYSEKDMQLLRRIHELLHEKGMTISGVQKMLKNPEKLPIPHIVSLEPVRSVRLAGTLIPFSVPKPIVKAKLASFHRPFHAPLMDELAQNSMEFQKNLSLQNNAKTIGQNESQNIEKAACSSSDSILLAKLEKQNQQMASLKTKYSHNLVEIKNELEELLILLPSQESC